MNVQRVLLNSAKHVQAVSAIVVPKFLQALRKWTDVHLWICQAV